MEFRKEDDKEEAVQGSDPPPLAATLPTFHTGVRTLLAAAPGGGRIRGGWQARSIEPVRQRCCQQLGRGARKTSAESRRAKAGTPRLRHNAGGGGKPLQEDDIHLHCCLVSKVRRRLGIRQLRRGNGTSCYWQGTDV